MATLTNSSTHDTLVVHARQSGAAESLVTSTLDGLDSYRNPVIRLLAADGLLRSEDRLREARRAAVGDLRAEGWTWARIASLLGRSRQRVWQIGNPEQKGP